MSASESRCIGLLRQPEGAKFQSGSKTTWVVAILLTGIFGAAVYQIVGRPMSLPTYGGRHVKGNAGGGNRSEPELPSRSAEKPGPSPMPPPPVMAPEFKVCPDCAEEIRFAARKCRFCRYSYEQQTVASERA